MLYLGFVVLIPFSSQVLGEYGGTLPAVVVYSANLTGGRLDRPVDGLGRAPFRAGEDGRPDRARKA